MLVLHPFIANLYLSASSQDASGFREWALDEVRHLVPFDAALWGKGSAISRRFHTVTLTGLGGTYPRDLEKTAAFNPMVPALQEAPGAAVDMADLVEDKAFHASKIYKKCFRKHGVERILSCSHVDSRSGLFSLVSLYRFDREARFTAEEKAAWSPMAYHLSKAATHAFFLHLTRPATETTTASAAVCDRHGMFHEVEPRFLDLLDEHFPDREYGTLPFELPGAADSFTIGELAVETSDLTDLVLVRIRNLSPIDQLTRRERQVVENVCQGLSHKEIGRVLGLAPTTVSSHLYRAYDKLGVSSRSALARLVRAGNRDHAAGEPD